MSAVNSNTLSNNINHDTMREFNMDLTADCDQLNLAHVIKNNKKLKLKQDSNCCAPYTLHSEHRRMVRV